MAYGVVRLDRVRSVYNGHIESVVHSGDLENGQVVQVGALVAGQRDLRQVVVPTAGAGDLALIAHSEINDDQTRRTDNALEKFYLPAGTAVRAYRLEKYDIFSISYDAITALAGGIPVKGNKVVAQAGLKLKEVASVTTEKFVGNIIDLEQLGTTTIVGQAGAVARITKLAVIEVLSN